jgi:hypothetical protein
VTNLVGDHRFKSYLSGSIPSLASKSKSIAELNPIAGVVRRMVVNRRIRIY